ncbi:Eco57I restriction-modification methylase domain-containing protein [Amycolatopsis sp. NPDC098790]|uniref:Eco57I restriction-modification methylase domain-containing protein n=1 Tax=Amycolatopsis sp. NPDC098790 TaxID=3363939 RepID=UPI00381A391B
MTVTAPASVPSYGEVFTRPWVAALLLDLVGYITQEDLGARRFLEPSCGSGAFLGPAVKRLIESANAKQRDPATLHDAVRAYDLRPENVAKARILCRSILTAAGVSETTADELTRSWIKCADFLLDDVEDIEIDFAVGNPPYIRYDDLTEETAVAYRKTWLTMRGRGDIYVGFIERCLTMLRDQGKLGFICADRWMRNQYGADLRKLVANRFSVEHIWTMHDVDAFETQVSAYPAITVLARSSQGEAVVADTNSAFNETSARELQDWAHGRRRVPTFSNESVKAHRVPHWFPGDELWPTGTPARLALIEYLNDNFAPIHDPVTTKTRVSIGVATGADKVYITRDADVAEEDRMLRLSMPEDLKSGEFQWQGNYLVNPWNKDGSLVPLGDYPKLAAYLSRHPAVRKRHVALKTPNAWYRTIDKVQFDLIARPKLLLQDMKAYINPVLEPGGCYPHHNLYYIVSDTWEMEVLGGILLSRIAQAFIEAYGVRMRGGTLRFQAQYLKQIKVPDPDSLSQETRQSLKDAFLERDVDAATKAAAKAYNIQLDEFELNSANQVPSTIKN